MKYFSRKLGYIILLIILMFFYLAFKWHNIKEELDLQFKTIVTNKNVNQEVHHADLSNSVYSYNYCLNDNNCEKKKGLPLNITSELMKHMHFPITEGFIEVTNDTVKDYVLITAASDNHFKESMDNIATAQLTFPLRKILYYDLGLSKGNLKQLSTLCRVEIKHFNFSNFPAHIRKYLGYCSWKPLVIHDALTQHTGVLYMDASIRFKLPLVMKTLPELYQQLVKSKGFLQLHKNGHSNYAVTHSDTYTYLVTNIELHKNISQYAAGFVFMYRTRETYQHVLKWYVLCALNQKCIAPAGSRLGCNFKKDRYTKLAGCHRYDQAVVNILQRNWFNFSDGGVFSVHMHTIDRGSYNKFKTQKCSKLG